MQVGAAFTVLQVSKEEARGPLELQAAKSRLLHTEPAAGALGLALLAARLQGMPSHHTLHLRSVNPHVAAIFQACPCSLLQPSSLTLPASVQQCGAPLHRDDSCFYASITLRFLEVDHAMAAHPDAQGGPNRTCTPEMCCISAVFNVKAIEEEPRKVTRGWKYKPGVARLV